ncbi:hypothetical protein K4F52_002937 [Lecanicillium sp. MT-2017a]|nr:hypothetical protein K4F52_002937 [Lecanicillium sp. MT-2017a]
MPEDRQREREPSQTPISQWRKQLKKVDELDVAVAEGRSAGPSKLLDRSSREAVFCDGNRSEPRLSKGPAAVEARYADDIEDHGRNTSSQPSRVSVRQVERALAGNHAAPPANEFRRSKDRELPLKGLQKSPSKSSMQSRDVRPGIMKSSTSKPREHSCLWRDRFMDLSAEVDQLRCELDSCDDTTRLEVNEQRSRDYKGKEKQPVSPEHECDDVWIEGLTVVVHLKGKDDLVINTDLRTT